MKEASLCHVFSEMMLSEWLTARYLQLKDYVETFSQYCTILSYFVILIGIYTYRAVGKMLFKVRMNMLYKYQIYLLRTIVEEEDGNLNPLYFNSSEPCSLPIVDTG